MANIYYAAPLHDPADRRRNEQYAKLLQGEGHKIYLPQWCGIWEDMVNEAVEKGIPQEEAIHKVRQLLFIADRDAIGRCDFVIAYFGHREPSEGALWEMGYAYGLGKPVYLYNPHGWKFNLMPEFGSRMFLEWDDLIAWLKQERFR